MLRPLCSETELAYSLNGRPDGSQSRSERFGQQKNEKSLSFTGILNPDRPARNLDAVKRRV